jgi:tellurium resistance protein TerD
MVNLVKGGNVNISKEAPASKHFKVELGWNPKADSTVKDDFDLDVIAVRCDANDKGAKETDVFFYNNVDGTGKKSSDVYPDNMSKEDVMKKAISLLPNGPIVLTKDNRTGEGDGADETLFVNPEKLADGKKVKITVNIYEALARRQNFGMVQGAFVRVLDDGGKEVCRYDLAEDFSIETGTIIGEFYKNNGDFKFKALGVGFTGDLNTLLTSLN